MSELTGRDEIADVVELLRPPAERDLPPGHLEQRRQLLLEAIAGAEAAKVDARSRFQSRLRRLVGWISALLAVIAVSLGATRAGAGSLSLDDSRLVQAAAAAGAATIVGAQAASLRREIGSVGGSQSGTRQARLMVAQR